MANALVWFRNDLRLDDQPALRAALDAGQVPLCIYIHAPDEEGAWRPGAASDAWRQRSLAALDASLRARVCARAGGLRGRAWGRARAGRAWARRSSSPGARPPSRRVAPGAGRA